MKATIIERVNAGMYLRIQETEYEHLAGVDPLLNFVKQRTSRLNHQHCLVFEGEKLVQCFYVDLDLNVIESDQKPNGGIWVHSVT